MRLIPWLAAGAAGWTLLEHLIHDRLGHRDPSRNPFGLEHSRHHAAVHYFAPAWKKAAAAVAIVSGLWGLLALPVGTAQAGAFALGLTAMYLGYELTHRRFHTRAPRGPVGRWLRRHHFHHHFHEPDANFGVTSPLWDWVFGTWSPAPKVRLPRRLAMPWLVDPETGRVRSVFAADYELT